MSERIQVILLYTGYHYGAAGLWPGYSVGVQRSFNGSRRLLFFLADVLWYILDNRYGRIVVSYLLFGMQKNHVFVTNPAVIVIMSFVSRKQILVLIFQMLVDNKIYR